MLKRLRRLVMTHIKFEAIVRDRFERCVKVLSHKAAEYASDVDRLQNFKDGAKFLNVTPSQYALALVTKHIVALKDHIMSGNPLSTEFIDEKIGDIINYMVLIEGIEEDNNEIGADVSKCTVVGL
jgi:hypothetical protein